MPTYVLAYVSSMFCVGVEYFKRHAPARATRDRGLLARLSTRSPSTTQTTCARHASGTRVQNLRVRRSRRPCCCTSAFPRGRSKRFSGDAQARRMAGRVSTSDDRGGKLRLPPGSFALHGPHDEKRWYAGRPMNAPGVSPRKKTVMPWMNAKKYIYTYRSHHTRQDRWTNRGAPKPLHAWLVGSVC